SIRTERRSTRFAPEIAWSVRGTRLPSCPGRAGCVDIVEPPSGRSIGLPTSGRKRLQKARIEVSGRVFGLVVQADAEEVLELGQGEPRTAVDDALHADRSSALRVLLEVVDEHALFRRHADQLGGVDEDLR